MTAQVYTVTSTVTKTYKRNYKVVAHSSKEALQKVSKGESDIVDDTIVDIQETSREVI